MIPLIFHLKQKMKLQDKTKTMYSWSIGLLNFRKNMEKFSLVIMHACIQKSGGGIQNIKYIWLSNTHFHDIISPAQPQPLSCNLTTQHLKELRTAGESGHQTLPWLSYKEMWVRLGRIKDHSFTQDDKMKNLSRLVMGLNEIHRLC